jgi:hypothetical protein
MESLFLLLSVIFAVVDPGSNLEPLGGLLGTSLMCHRHLSVKTDVRHTNALTNGLVHNCDRNVPSDVDR